MSELTIDILKKIIENIPDEYVLGFSNESCYHSIRKMEIDVANEMVVFK